MENGEEGFGFVWIDLLAVYLLGTMLGLVFGRVLGFVC